MASPPNRQLDAALQLYRAALPRQTRLIDLAGQVLHELAAVQAGLPSAPELSADELAARLAAGAPLQPQVPIAAPLFRQTLDRLLALARQFELLPPLSDPQRHHLLALPPLTWLQESPAPVEICPPQEAPAGLLFFLGQKALAPFYHQAAAPCLPEFLQGAWTHSACPFCGQPPALASLSPDTGQRLLYCSLCAAQWPFPRRTCVFCGHAESHFSYIFADDDPARRADLCQACRRYLKTIVGRRLPHAPYLPLEEFVTVDLDALMARGDLLD